VWEREKRREGGTSLVGGGQGDFTSLGLVLLPAPGVYYIFSAHLLVFLVRLTQRASWMPPLLQPRDTHGEYHS